MANWLFKTEPGDYSFDDLQHDGSTVWDGIQNNWALKNLRQVRQGDRVLVYHTGSEKALVGAAKVASDPYPDPHLRDARLVVVDLVPVRALSRPVTLAEIKADTAFAEFELVRFSRLSVLPVSQATWNRLMRLARDTDD